MAGTNGTGRIFVPPTESQQISQISSRPAEIEALVEELDIYNDPGDWRYVGLAIGLLVVILGTSGNGLTVWAYKSNRNLQTSFNVLIANLCCIELIFSFVIIPLQLPGMIIQNPPYPETFCTIAAYFYYCSYAASLHNLVAIAINRYIGIVNTKRYQSMFTGNKLRLWVLSIWLTSPLLYIPLAAGGNYGWSNKTLRCAIRDGNGGIYGISIYNMILTIIYQAGGLLILIILYTAIIKKVKHVQHKLKVHKQASFRRSGASAKRSGTLNGEAKIELHTPGTTSGEEGIDDYRPSSIISGGFQFRPAKGSGGHYNWPSDTTKHGSDRDMASVRSKHILSDNTNSHISNMTPLRSPSPMKTPPKEKRRTSIWQVLFRIKVTEEKQEQHNDSPVAHTFDFTTDDESKKDHTNDIEDPLQEVKVVLRNMDENKKNIRRKKSLSAPTLPTPEEIMAVSRKNSAIVAQKVPEKVDEVQETTSTSSSPRLSRSYTVGGKYKKNFTRGVNNGSVRLTSENSRFLHPSSIPSRLSVEDKVLCSSLPAIPPTVTSAVDPSSHTKFGTIAKRIKDQKSKREKRSKRREKVKALKRRHARERQLVYSSLWICIAFAVLILPTSLLFVVQSLFKFEAPASAVLILGSISWLHSVVNPFIYGYMNHLYRKEYTQIAKGIEKKITTCVK